MRDDAVRSTILDVGPLFFPLRELLPSSSLDVTHGILVEVLLVDGQDSHFAGRHLALVRNSRVVSGLEPLLERCRGWEVLGWRPKPGAPDTAELHLRPTTSAAPPIAVDGPHALQAPGRHARNAFDLTEEGSAGGREPGNRRQQDGPGGRAHAALDSRRQGRAAGASLSALGASLDLAFAHQPPERGHTGHDRSMGELLWHHQHQERHRHPRQYHEEGRQAVEPSRFKASGSPRQDQQPGAGQELGSMRAQRPPTDAPSQHRMAVHGHGQQQAQAWQLHPEQHAGAGGQLDGSPSANRPAPRRVLSPGQQEEQRSQALRHAGQAMRPRQPSLPSQVCEDACIGAAEGLGTQSRQTVHNERRTRHATMDEGAGMDSALYGAHHRLGREGPQREQDGLQVPSHRLVMIRAPQLPQAQQQPLLSQGEAIMLFQNGQSMQPEALLQPQSKQQHIDLGWGSAVIAAGAPQRLAGSRIRLDAGPEEQTLLPAQAAALAAPVPAASLVELPSPLSGLARTPAGLLVPAGAAARPAGPGAPTRGKLPVTFLPAGQLQAPGPAASDALEPAAHALLLPARYVAQLIPEAASGDEAAILLCIDDESDLRGQAGGGDGSGTHLRLTHTGSLHVQPDRSGIITGGRIGSALGDYEGWETAGWRILGNTHIGLPLIEWQVRRPGQASGRGDSNNTGFAIVPVAADVVMTAPTGNKRGPLPRAGLRSVVAATGATDARLRLPAAVSGEAEALLVPTAPQYKSVPLAHALSRELLGMLPEPRSQAAFAYGSHGISDNGPLGLAEDDGIAEEVARMLAGRRALRVLPLQQMSLQGRRRQPPPNPGQQLESGSGAERAEPARFRGEPEDYRTARGRLPQAGGLVDQQRPPGKASEQVLEFLQAFLHQQQPHFTQPLQPGDASDPGAWGRRAAAFTASASSGNPDGDSLGSIAHAAASLLAGRALHMHYARPHDGPGGASRLRHVVPSRLGKPDRAPSAIQPADGHAPDDDHAVPGLPTRAALGHRQAVHTQRARPWRPRAPPGEWDGRYSQGRRQQWVLVLQGVCTAEDMEGQAGGGWTGHQPEELHDFGGSVTAHSAGASGGGRARAGAHTCNSLGAQQASPPHNPHRQQLQYQIQQQQRPQHDQPYHQLHARQQGSLHHRSEPNGMEQQARRRPSWSGEGLAGGSGRSAQQKEDAEWVSTGAGGADAKQGQARERRRGRQDSDEDWEGVPERQGGRRRRKENATECAATIHLTSKARPQPTPDAPSATTTSPSLVSAPPAPPVPTPAPSPADMPVGTSAAIATAYMPMPAATTSHNSMPAAYNAQTPIPGTSATATSSANAAASHGAKLSVPSALDQPPLGWSPGQGRPQARGSSQSPEWQREAERTAAVATDGVEAVERQADADAEAEAAAGAAPQDAPAGLDAVETEGPHASPCRTKPPDSKEPGEGSPGRAALGGMRATVHTEPCLPEPEGRQSSGAHGFTKTLAASPLWPAIKQEPTEEHGAGQEQAHGSSWNAGQT